MRAIAVPMYVGGIFLLFACRPNGTEPVEVKDHEGRPIARYTLSKGMKQGDATILYPNGQVRKHGAYVRDLRVGTWIELSDKGDTLARIGYAHGKMEGPCTWWADNGQVLREEHFHNGVLDGEALKFHRDGSPERRLNFRRGQAEGPGVIWSTIRGTGEVIHADGAYHDGQREGIWTTYREDGSIAAKGRFLHGDRIGPWVWYNADGSVLDSVIFRNGKVFERFGPVRSR